jgi:hypothetical protein
MKSPVENIFQSEAEMQRFMKIRPRKNPPASEDADALELDGMFSLGCEWSYKERWDENMSRGDPKANSFAAHRRLC